MAIETLHTLEIIEAMENFLDRKRPKESIRSKVDLSYTIEKQSVIIFEIRPDWRRPKEIVEIPIAKATYVMTKKMWKVFWKQADMKWHAYTPEPLVPTIRDFTLLVEQDEYYCFWG